MVMDGLYSALRRFTSGLETRIKLLARRCILSAILDDNPVQTVSVKLFRGEERTGVERIQEYGFSSVPREGAQAIVLFLGGECSHPVVIATDDRRYRPTGQAPGDSMMYTDKDREAGHRIHLVSGDRSIRARGESLIIHVDGEAKVVCKTAAIEAGETATIRAGKEILLDTPVMKCTGDIIDQIGGTGTSMARMRETYNAHVHPENDHGGPTGVPSQRMG